MSGSPTGTNPGGRHPSPIEVAFAIDEWFREHVGIPIDSSDVDDAREWCLRRLDGTREPLLVRVSHAALSLPGKDLFRLLHELHADAKSFPPDPPGYYLITLNGLSVRGMIRIVWDLHGQEVRCFTCTRLTSASGAVAERREWRVSVDHVDRGKIDGAAIDDDRDTIKRLAEEHIRRTGSIRVPPAPWTWSVMDAKEQEWWGRVDTTDGRNPEVRLVLARTKHEKRLPWEPGLQPPSPAELRDLVRRARQERS